MIHVKVFCNMSPIVIYGKFLGGSAGKDSICDAGDLGWEDPLEKGKATHSSILAWRIPWTVKSWTRLSDFHTPTTEKLYLEDYQCLQKFCLTQGTIMDHFSPSLIQNKTNKSPKTTERETS